MIQNRVLWFIVGGFIYISIITLCFNKYMVFADTLIKQVDDIKENMDDRLIIDTEEFEQGDDKILQDTISSFEVSEDQEESENDIEDSEEDMEKDYFKIMVIFSFGLLSGLIVGQMLLGFLK